MRPFKNKKSVVFDIAGNNESLGSPSNYTIIKNGKLHEVISERGRLTTKIIGENDCLRFGKHKDQDIKKVPEGYLTWCKENLDNSNAISLVTCELKRRKLFEAELMETTLSERMANFEMV